MKSGDLPEMIKLAQIELEHVSFAGEGKKILEDVSLSIEQGDFVSVTGPSGSGKSTLLKLCSHLISPSEGTIRVFGKDIFSFDPVELRRRISYCPQTPVLFGNTVEENLLFPCRIRRTELDRGSALSLLSAFQMGEEYLARDVQKLSGGEKQRVALVRTLLFRPEALLLDEPTAALDEENARIVEQAVSNLNRGGVTVVWVTHSDEQSRRCASRRLTVEGGRIRSIENLKDPPNAGDVSFAVR